MESGSMVGDGNEQNNSYAQNQATTKNKKGQKLKSRALSALDNQTKSVKKGTRLQSDDNSSRLNSGGSTLNEL